MFASLKQFLIRIYLFISTQYSSRKLEYKIGIRKLFIVFNKISFVRKSQILGYLFIRFCLITVLTEIPSAPVIGRFKRWIGKLLMPFSSIDIYNPSFLE